VTLVVDASMTISWLFRDERSELTQTVLRKVAAEGAFVPSIWRLEVANVLRNAVRRGRCDEGYAARSLRRLGRLRIIADNETDRQAWGATRNLSRQHGLTLYDAAYLELALRRRHALATRDAALLRSGRAAGIEVVGD
jgi:predicted nucleic acid-binding protein